MLNSEELKKRLMCRLRKKRQEFATKSMCFVENPLKAGTELLIGPNKYEVPHNAFLVIIDEDPRAYWTHPVIYELHEVETGEVIVIHEEYPLEKPDLEEELVVLHTQTLPQVQKEGDEDFFEGSRVDLGKLEEGLRTTSYDLSRPCVAHRHALFVTGMDNMSEFHDDFWRMRKILVERYGYDPNNIVIAMGNGDGYLDLPVDYPGTVAGLDTALDEYAPGGARELGPDDTLFLYTFNHGGWDHINTVWLCMHPNWGKYYDYQLKAKLDNINCGNLIVAMNQCHSGGFIPEVLSTTGPSQVAIMTACREDQSAYPAVAPDPPHGYFSVVLYTALNWEFPAEINPGFPGHVTGPVDVQDTNGDGMVCAEEAWHYVHDMMNANHWYTINGHETPQWGESSPGVGASLFWGRPDIEVEDGTLYWWESPDVYLHDPAVTPNDLTAVSSHPANWEDNYHPDAENRIVARVHNTGCAPCRDITVEFRVMSFGTGGGTTFVGTYHLEDIDPGHHGFAYKNWYFDSALDHECVMVRADCAGDPALSFGTPINTDDNQAQRNLDPSYAAPYFAETQEEQVIKRAFTIQNDLEKEGVFGVFLPEGETESELIKTEIPDIESLHEIRLKPRQARQTGQPQEIEGQVKKVEVRFIVSPRAGVGERLRLPIEIRRIQPDPAVVGGVTLLVEVATGHLEGRIVSREKTLCKEGIVALENTKQKELKYTAEVDRKGTFSFENINPGPYRIWAECKDGYARESVFVEPNSVTTKVLILEHRPEQVGGVFRDERGKPIAHCLLAVRDPRTNSRHLVRTNAVGMYNIPGMRPGEYEITMPEKKKMGPRKVSLDFLSSEKAE